MPRLTSKGQVTIPKPLRDRLGLRAGTEVRFELHDDVIVLRKAVREDLIDKWVGALDLAEGVDAFVERLRSEA